MNEAFLIDRGTRDKLISQDAASAEIIKPVVGGRELSRYSIKYSGRFLILSRRGIDIGKYPAIREHLSQFKQHLTPKKNRTDSVGRKPGAYEWYELQDAVDYYQDFAKPKIIFPDIATECRFYLDKQGYFGTNTTYIIPHPDLYLLAILNSRLALAYFREKCAGLEGGGEVYLRFFGDYLEHFPVHVAGDSSHEKKRQNQLIESAQQMLDLNKRLGEVKTEHEKTALRRQIDATDRQIDQLVYDLYGLTADEIRLVEQSTS